MIKNEETTEHEKAVARIPKLADILEELEDDIPYTAMEEAFGFLVAVANAYSYDCYKSPDITSLQDGGIGLQWTNEMRDSLFLTVYGDGIISFSYIDESNKVRGSFRGFTTIPRPLKGILDGLFSTLEKKKETKDD